MAIVNRGFKGRQRQAGAGLIPPGQSGMSRRIVTAVAVSGIVSVTVATSHFTGQPPQYRCSRQGSP